MRVFPHIFLIAVVLLAGCGGKGGRSQAGTEETKIVRSFPEMPKAPSMLSGDTEKYVYIANHFWDAFLDKEYPGDTSVVNGVPKDDVESALGRYVTILENFCPRVEATKSVGAFFRKVNDFQKANPSSDVFGYFQEMVPKYLYDPNSPVRDEDLYRPYALGLVSSDLVSEDLKPAYSREAEMCALNQVGTPAADIRFTTLGGKRRTLYSIDSDLVLLFFSNPGCPACEDVIERLTLSQSVKSLISSGRLAVVNLYIDLEIDKWRAYASEYPKSWINGFDQDYTIRQDLTYNVRAIPSMYVLDKDKVVLIKDAPVERVLAYLENI